METHTLISGVSSRPSRLAEVKNRDYHLRQGRWSATAGFSAKRVEHVTNMLKNERFASPNKQWMESEDMQNFLMDITGQTTSRIKVEVNYIQILLNQMVGNVARMDIDMRAESFSPHAKVRKEEKLMETLMYQDIANAMPEGMGDDIRANRPIGRSDMETVSMFDNYYVDDYLRATNSLLKYSREVNNLDLLKSEISQDVGLYGMGILFPKVEGREYVIKRVLPKEFFFDRKARRWDISDADFMGHYEDAVLTDILERGNELSSHDRTLLDNHITFYNIQSDKRIRVYYSVWRDTLVNKWGYVKNEYGDIVFEKIDCIYENEEKARYTMKDLVPYSELTKYQKDVLGNPSNKISMTMKYTDQWRYCEFVPAEYLTSTKYKDNELSDIVLNYGVLPYQQQNTYSPFNMETPYKVAFYLYIDGYVYSPLDIAINPQRVANRIMSVVENMLNSANIGGTVVANESINKISGMDLTDVSLKLKRGEVVGLNAAAFGSVQNAIGKVESNLGQGAFNFMNMASTFLTTIEKITGVNDAMKGQMERPDQLVGTMQLMIQRGTVIQERYYGAIREIFKQSMQAVVSSGRRFYINERPKLSAIVGDKGVDVLTLTKEMANEEHRVKLSFTVNPQEERQFVDGTLFKLLEFGLIDKVRFGNSIGRASLDDMWSSVRESIKEQVEAEKQMAEIQAQEQQMAQEQQGQREQQAIESMDRNQEENRRTKLADTMLKQLGEQSKEK